MNAGESIRDIWDALKVVKRGGELICEKLYPELH